MGLWVVVSFEARESNRNWKFVCASALGLYRRNRAPKSCAELMATFPSIMGRTSIFTDTRAARIISCCCWSRTTRSSRISRLGSPKSTCPTLTCVPRRSLAKPDTLSPRKRCATGRRSTPNANTFSAMTVQRTMLKPHLTILTQLLRILNHFVSPKWQKIARLLNYFAKIIQIIGYFSFFCQFLCFIYLFFTNFASFNPTIQLNFI